MPVRHILARVFVEEEERIGIDAKQTRARANLADVWRDVVVVG